VNSPQIVKIAFSIKRSTGCYTVKNMANDDEATELTQISLDVDESSTPKVPLVKNIVKLKRVPDW